MTTATGESPLRWHAATSYAPTQANAYFYHYENFHRLTPNPILTTLKPHLNCGDQLWVTE